MANIISELLEKRTRNSKHYLLDNGQMRCVVLQGQHYQAEDGSLQDVDNNLEYLGGEVLDSETSEQFTHKCDKIDLPVAFNKFRQTIKIGKGAEKILIRPLDANQVEGVKYLNKVTYTDAYTNVDVERFAFADGYGEKYILKSPGHPTRFEFDVPVGLANLEQWYKAGVIENSIDDIRVCVLTWTANGFYFDLPDLNGLNYPIEVV